MGIKLFKLYTKVNGGAPCIYLPPNNTVYIGGRYGFNSKDFGFHLVVV